MSKINKFLIIFIAFFVLVLFGIWRVLQSPFFASVVSDYINERIIKNSEIDFSVENLTFKVFPPATKLENVRFGKEGIASGQFQEISLIFSPWDFLKSDLKIAKIMFDNGYLKVKEFKGNKNSRNNYYREFRNEVIDKLPFSFGSVSLIDTDVQYANQIISISEVRMSTYTKSLEFYVDLDNLAYSSSLVDNVKASFEVSEKKVRFKEVNISKNSSLISLTGNYNYLLNDPLNFKVKYKGSIGDFIPPQITKEHGLEAFCLCDFQVSGNFSNPKIIIKANLKKFKSIYADADEMKVTGSSNNKEILIQSVNFKKNNGEGFLRKPISINLSKDLDFTAHLSSQNLHSHDFLKILGKPFQIINTRATGNVQLRISENNINIWSDENVILKKMKIGNEDPLLAIEKLDIKNFRFDVDDSVLMSVDAYVDGSKVNIEGFVKNNFLKINGDFKKISLEKLGGILGDTVSGRGNVLVNIDSKLDDVKILVSSPKIKKLKILNYELLEESKVSLSYNFNNSVLLLDDVESFGAGRLKGRGEVDFENEKINIQINSSKALFEGLSYRIGPIWNSVKLYVEPLAGEIDGNFTLKGSLNNFLVYGDVSSEKFSIYNESFDTLKTRFVISGAEVIIKDLELTKDKSKINFNMAYDYVYGFKSSSLNVYEYKVSSSDFYRKLNLGYDGIINSNIKLLSENSKLDIEGQVSLLRSFVGRKKVKPSNVVFKYKNEVFSAAGILLGGKGKIDTEVYTGRKKRKKSKLNLELDLDDLRTIFGIISLHNIYDQDLEGQLKGSIRSTFSLNSYRDLFVDASIEKLEIKKISKFIKLKEQGKLKIESGYIKEMGLAAKGNGGFFNLSGQGDLLKSMKVEQNFNLDLSFLHILSNSFERLAGKVFGRGVLSGNVHSISNFHEFSGDDIYIKVKRVPLLLNNSSFNASLNNDEIKLSRFEGKIGDGDFTSHGTAKLLLPLPAISMHFDFDEVNYPFGDKSNINLGGAIKLQGKSFPYEYLGTVIINNGRMNDEFSDLSGGSDFIKSVDKYIGHDSQGIPDIITLNIQAKTRDSIRIKNRLSDILVVGDINIVGNPLSPSYEGKLNVIPELSKFKFKGNEFFISRGLVNLSSQDTSSPIVLNFSSEAKVGQYDIQMDVTGGVEDLNVNLESNPALSKEDIFSLLTLGITTDYTKNLEDKDRASLTTIGLGTLLVDQLEINEGLNSSLGLKLSVLPEVSDSNDSPIEASGTEQVNKVKTSTKLKVQKKITDKVDVTFSNTFGSETGQKQEINIDLNINESFSIQGVFEKEEDDKNTDTDNSDSVGADLKWRFSF